MKPFFKIFKKTGKRGRINRRIKKLYTTSELKYLFGTSNPRKAYRDF